MPTPAVDTLGSLTRKVWFDRKIYDQTLGHIPFFPILYNSRRPWSGGNYGAMAVQLLSPSASVFIRGFDPIPLTQHDTKREAVYVMNYQRHGIKFSYEDIFRSSDESLANIIQDQLTTVGNQLQDDVEQICLYGNEAANEPAGVAYAVDDGTLAANYLGLSRTTYTNWRANVTAAATTLAYSPLETAFSTTIQGQYVANMILTTRALRNAFAVMIAPQYRIVLPTDYGETGYRDSLVFNGVPIRFSDKVQANQWYTLNLDTFQMLVDPAGDFTFSKPEVIPGQDAWYVIMRFNWTLVCKRPRANHKFTNLTP